MPTVAEHLARKQMLLERLHEKPGLNEQDEIEHLLVRINVMLNSLDITPIADRIFQAGESRQAPGPQGVRYGDDMPEISRWR
jgi:hypothetical protein